MLAVIAAMLLPSCASKPAPATKKMTAKVIYSSSPLKPHTNPPNLPDSEPVVAISAAQKKKKGTKPGLAATCLYPFAAGLNLAGRAILIPTYVFGACYTGQVEAAAVGIQTVFETPLPRYYR